MNRFSVSCLVLAIGSLWMAGPHAAVPLASAAQTGKLLQAEDLQYVGSFRVPGSIGAGQYEYGGSALAFNPSRNSLFLIGWQNGYATAELGIPEIGGTASVIQPFRDPFEGRLAQIGATDNRVGGQLVYNGRLHVTGFVYYDANGAQSQSHFSRPLDLSVSGQVTGPTRVGPMQAGFYSGYMATVPGSLREAFGGPAVTGNCCIPIISRTSQGPALFAFDPDRPGSARPLLYYPANAPLEQYGLPGPHPIFNGSTSITGVVIPEGTGSVLFFGSTGIGDYCYGNGVECKDPVNAEKGEHGYPYRAYVWAYRQSDLASVGAGNREPWEVRPYATWALHPFATQNAFGSGGAAYDPATKRLYFVERNGDSGILPRVHVYRIGDGSSGPGSGDTEAPSVSLVSPGNGSVVSGQVKLSAQASDNVSVRGVQFVVDAVNVGSEITSPPYETTWSTNGTADGWHLLAAVARDAAGNIGSSSTASVQVANTGDGGSGQAECADQPLSVRVLQWPSDTNGTRRLMYKTTGPARIVSVSLSLDTPNRLTVSDARGCSATAVRDK